MATRKSWFPIDYTELARKEDESLSALAQQTVHHIDIAIAERLPHYRFEFAIESFILKETVAAFLKNLLFYINTTCITKNCEISVFLRNEKTTKEFNNRNLTVAMADYDSSKYKYSVIVDFNQ